MRIDCDMYEKFNKLLISSFKAHKSNYICYEIEDKVVQVTSDIVQEMDEQILKDVEFL
jgi:hypothetical protein